jgi:adenylate kinase
MAISQRLAVSEEDIAHFIKTGICILISGYWNILPEELFEHLSCKLLYCVVMNSRKVKLAGNVTDMREMRNAHKILTTPHNGPNRSGSLFPISS